MPNQIKFSIIIPSFNGGGKIGQLISALNSQKYRNFEIIIILDGSTDGTEGLAKQLLSATDFNYQIIWKPNSGRGQTRNFGLKYAQNEYLIFFDDDMVPAPDCIGSFQNFHQNYPDSIAVGTQLENIDWMKTDFQSYKAFLSQKWSINESETPVKYSTQNIHLTAANFSLPKSLFLLLKGFDERLSDVEDFELATRALAMNIPIYFLPTAHAWHNDFVTSKSYIQRQRQYNSAYQKLLKIRPELLNQFEQTKIRKPSLLQKVMYFPFSFTFWSNWIDDEVYFIKIIPQKWRYKIYDWVVWSQGKIFAPRPKTT